MKVIDAIGGTILALLTGSIAFAGEQATFSQPAGRSAAPAPDLAGVPVADRGAAITWKLVTNGPVADTPANRAKYQPLSHAGRRTAPDGD